MKKYKVEGYIKVPVDVSIFADSASDACAYAQDAVMDEIPRGSSIVNLGNIEYQFADDDTITVIGLGDDYEYDFNSADEIKS